MGLLAGVRVVELGHGPLTGLCTMVLADFGAEVIWLDPEPSVGRYTVWQRGKARRGVMLPEDAARVRELIHDTADVYVTGLTTPELERLELTPDDLTKRRPELITVQLTGFPQGDGYGALPPVEGLAAAFMGRMLTFEGVARRPGPVVAALPVGTHAAAQSACAAILAALLPQRAERVGQHIAGSQLQGLLPYELYQLLALQNPPEGEPLPVPDPHEVMPTLNYQPVRCSDGRWLQLGNLLPHLLDNFLATVGLHEILDDPAYAERPWPPEVEERYRLRVLEHMQSQTAAHWMARFVEHGGVVAHPFQTTREALDDADITCNEHVVETGELRQLGLLARLEATPGQVGAPPREIDWPVAPASRAHGAGTRARRLPLEGVTVIECATIIAAPYGASLLADLGARVIKVEALGGEQPGDPFRAMLHGLGAARVNTGKESICLDLKRSEAQAVMARLAARADILIHNYRTGVPERLGMGYETLAALNPKLVYVAANGYGPDGPGARRPSTHPIPGAALGGVLHQFGGVPNTGPRTLEALRDESRRLYRANELNPDPNTSVVVATAALLGLCAQRWQGTGQRVWVDMFGANAYANFDDFLDHPGKPVRVPPDPDLLGFGPLEQLYRCAEGWVFLALPDEASWQRFRTELRDPALEAWPDRASAARDVAVRQTLERLFASATAARWEARLVPRGIGCVQADVAAPGARLLDDPYFDEHGLVVAAHAPQFGAYRRHGPVVRLTPGGPQGGLGGGEFGGTCEAGQHTRALLVELGFDARACDSMMASGAAK